MANAVRTSASAFSRDCFKTALLAVRAKAIACSNTSYPRQSRLFCSPRQLQRLLRPTPLVSSCKRQPMSFKFSPAGMRESVRRLNASIVTVARIGTIIPAVAIAVRRPAIAATPPAPIIGVRVGAFWSDRFGSVRKDLEFVDLAAAPLAGAAFLLPPLNDGLGCSLPDFQSRADQLSYVEQRPCPPPTGALCVGGMGSDWIERWQPLHRRRNGSGARQHCSVRFPPRIS